MLRFGSPHPTELAVRAPDGTWYFVAYDKAGMTGDDPALAKDTLARLDEFRLPPATAVGRPWASRREKNERIFSTPGRYEVVLTDALESDAARAVYRCFVNYQP